MSDMPLQIAEPRGSYLNTPQFAEYLESIHLVLQGEYISDIDNLGLRCMELFLQDNPFLCINPADMDVALFISAKNRMNNGEHITLVYEEIFGVKHFGIKDERIARKVEQDYAKKTQETLNSLAKHSLTAKILRGPWHNTTRS